MKLLNKQEKSNELLSRKEFKVEVEFEGSAPTKEKAKKVLCKSLSVDESLTVIRGIYTGFRSNTAKIELFVYSKKEELDRIESYLMHKKIEEKIKKADEADAAKKAEEKEAVAEKEPAKEEKKEGEQ